MVGRLRRSLNRFRRARRGEALAEFAVVGGLLVASLAALAVIGLHVVERQALERAASQTAALAATIDAGASPGTGESTGLELAFTQTSGVAFGGAHYLRVRQGTIRRDPSLGDSVDWNWTIVDDGGYPAAERPDPAPDALLLDCGDCRDGETYVVLEGARSIQVLDGVFSGLGHVATRRLIPARVQ